MPRANETSIAVALMKIARTRDNGVVTFKRAYKEVPDFLNLNSRDLEQSETRPNEKMWQQLVRNIKSHDNVEGNFIHDGLLEHVPRIGYKITREGISFLSRR